MASARWLLATLVAAGIAAAGLWVSGDGPARPPVNAPAAATKIATPAAAKPVPTASPAAARTAVGAAPAAAATAEPPPHDRFAAAITAAEQDGSLALRRERPAGVELLQSLDAQARQEPLPVNSPFGGP